MGIKSDKTFEEIVERLVALVRPEPKEADTRDVPPHTPEHHDLERASPRHRPESPDNRRKR
jgi:hypothetical protein